MHIVSQDDSPTYGDLIAFVLLNRGDKCFVGYDEDQIAKKIHSAIQAGTLYYCTNGDGRISGMILATKIEEHKILFIDENLSMSMHNLQRFAHRARHEFAGYRLEWFKHGKHHFDEKNKIYDKLAL